MSQKLTFEQLKNHLWTAADILRGSLDASEFRQPIMSLLFLKRINDQFEERAEKLEKSGKSKKTAWDDPDRHAFFVPKSGRWQEISNTFENLGEKLDKICNVIERANPNLSGVLTNISYNYKKKYPDDVLLQLISHFNKTRLRNSDLENEDIFGQAYEYLLEQFADSAGKKAGEFFTPREVVRLLVEILEPRQGMKICDPTCGSGGMLIWSRKYVKEHKQNPKNISIHGQERNFGNYSMCIMNMILHGIENFRIEHENVISNPLLVENGSLLTYDLVIANFPFSMKANYKNLDKDPFNRFQFGIPSKNFADYLFIQHMISILNKKGRAAIISSNGILFRGQQEHKIREKLIESDLIEGVIILPKNLFYGTGVPACVLILNKAKSEKMKKKIFFVNATKDFQHGGKRDILRTEDIKKTITSIKNYKEKPRYFHIATIDELRENNHNLNLARYMDISESIPELNIQETINKVKKLDEDSVSMKKKLQSELSHLGFKI